jgi:CheY-like chemotaxis protein
MARDGADKRTRVLVVEDIETLRESYMLNLELEGEFRVHGARDLQEAITALARCTYHVALVDIMLAGESDESNRDGVTVLERIRDLGEGTQAVALSGQRHTQLAAQIVRDYGAFDYLDKNEVSQVGFAAIAAKVTAAATASPVGAVPSWDAIAATLGDGRSEAVFVSELMGELKFKGGAATLTSVLPAAAQHLAPLAPATTGGGVSLDPAQGTFHGSFWSKGQGCAIDFAIGRTADAPQVGDADASSDLLVARDKAGLSVRVVRLSDCSRDAFRMRDLETFTPRPDNR